MPKRLSRLLCLCLAAVFLLGAFPFMGFAETTEEIQVTEPTPTESPPEESTGDTEEDIPPLKARAGIGSVYKNGMIWGGDADDEFDIVHPGGTYHYEKVSMYMLYNKGAYNAAYCIAPTLDFEGTYYYTKNEFTVEDPWPDLTEDQRRAIGLALLYGYPNNIDSSVSKLKKRGAQGATQMIITEICFGFRSAVPPFELLDSRIVDLFYSDEKGNRFTDGGSGSNNGTVRNLKECYYALAQNMADHMVVPSFAATDYDFAPTYEMTPVGDGTYTVTLTDTNDILSKCIFTDTEDVKYTVEGNQLTVVSTSPEAVIEVDACKNIPNLETQTFLVWTYEGKQPMAQAGEATDDPMPLYFKLKTKSSASLSIQKVTQDGLNLAGWRFSIYADQPCTQLLSGPHTTNSNGQITVTGLAAGTVWVKELGNADDSIDALYTCLGSNPQEALLTVGSTAYVYFENVFRKGTCKIIKTLEDPNMGTLSGWEFTIHKLLENGTAEYVDTVTTGTDGTILAELEPGKYRITEELPEDSPWECTSALTQEVTVQGGEQAEVHFTNALRTGQIRIQKTNHEGKALSGVVFLLEWSLDGDAWQPVFYSNTVQPGGCNNGNVVDGILITTVTGRIVYGNLYPDLYYRLTEVSTRDGYQLLTEPAFEGKLPAEHDHMITLTVVNVPVFKLPETGGRSFWLCAASLLVCLGAGACLLVYNRKR